MRPITLISLLFLSLAALRVEAQTVSSDNTKPMSGMSMPMSGMQMPADKAKMSMSGMTMTSSVSVTDPMNREGSGTSWLPDSTPMFGKMRMFPNGNMLMLHGAAMPRYTDVGSKRGDRRFDAPNWIMGMLSHPLTSTSQIGYHAMFSLDPVTEGGYGYPLLFQTGETWHHVPLHDRQHPHDLVDELSATYSKQIAPSRAAYLYLAYPGEPALGPPTYMHRLISYDLADAPIGHHWQDATHITFGVATVGVDLTHNLKIEGSSFTGREPDENRYSFDKPRFDSQSARLAWNPDRNDALQVSFGAINNPEGDGVFQHRTTASWIYNKPLGPDSNFTTSLVWGQNDLATEGRSNSYLAEADYQHHKDTLYTRIENIQKSGNELVLPAPLDNSTKYDINAFTVGYVRDLSHGKSIDTGIGGAVTVDTKPSSLDSIYGSGTPMSFQIYLRFRSSRSESGGMGSMKMSGMAMGNMDQQNQSMPMQSSSPAAQDQENQPMAVSTPPTQPAIIAPLAAAPMSIATSFVPTPPAAGKPEALTVTVTSSSGKPVTGAKLTSDVAMASMDMGTTHSSFKEVGGGKYQTMVSFGMAGTWHVTIHATPAGGKAMTKVVDVQVGM